MPDEVKLLPCEDLSDDKCAICGKHKSRHSTGSGFGMCQIYPLFVSEREMLESLTRAIEATRPTLVTDEVVEKVAKIIDPVWMNPPEGPHVLENYPGQADKYRNKARSTSRAAIAAMKDAASD